MIRELKLSLLHRAKARILALPDHNPEKRRRFDQWERRARAFEKWVFEKGYDKPPMVSMLDGLFWARHDYAKWLVRNTPKEVMDIAFCKKLLQVATRVKEYAEDENQLSRSTFVLREACRSLTHKDVSGLDIWAAIKALPETSRRRRAMRRAGQRRLWYADD